MSVLAVVLAYVIGSISFALLVARLVGRSDLRLAGSGNLGATNVARTSGLAAGVLVAVLDVMKGVAGVVLAERLSGGNLTIAAVAGLATVTGHIYPIWYRFRGGKGVATACGAFAILAPAAALAATMMFALGAVFTRYASVGSMLGALTLPIAAYAGGSPPPIVPTAIATSGLVLFRHRANLARLWAGVEPRLGARA